MSSRVGADGEKELGNREKREGGKEEKTNKKMQRKKPRNQGKYCKKELHLAEK